MQHLIIIGVMAVVPLGAWVAMGEGMVLDWWAKLVSTLPTFLQKPLATCPRCMVSAWGIPAALFTFPDLNLWLLPVYLLAACGLQEAIHR
jgi:hypothetical protein